MVEVVSGRICLWLLSVFGIFAIITTTITCSEAYTANSLDKVVNGSISSNPFSFQHTSKHSGNVTTSLMARLEKTSFKCEGKPSRLCESSRHPENAHARNRSRSEEKVAFRTRLQLRNGKSHNKKRKSDHYNNYRSNKSISENNSDYMPVRYGPYGYQDDVSEQARSWITVPLFIFFSIIQFKLVAAIFLAFFGPMILFLLVVQGFLFKATLILMGLMMT